VTPLDDLLVEADRIGLRVTVENGNVRARFFGPDDAGVEELLRALHNCRGELVDRLASRETPPPPVIVKDSRAVAHPAARPSPSAPPPPAWSRLDSRLWGFAESELLTAVVAKAEQHGLSVTVDREKRQVQLSDTDSAKAFEPLLCNLSPPPPAPHPGAGLSTEVVSARSLEAIDLIRAGGSLPDPSSTSLSTSGVRTSLMRATLAAADARGIMVGSIRPRQSDPLDQLRDDYVALARKWGYTR
jgi:hypothetical protein